MTGSARILALAATLLLAACVPVTPVTTARGLIIQDVTVVSPERDSPMQGADVLIRDGRIAAIGAHLSPAPGALRIDGHGRYLIPGLNGRLEMQHWTEAGIPPARILKSATLDNATAFGQGRDLGSIEVGKRADLLLLGADPLESVTAYDAIETIFLNGQPVGRATLRPVE
jgi:imidazolonepropionase-like amidohydrolase